MSWHLPCSTIIVDLAVLSTDPRGLQGEDHVSTMVLSPPSGPGHGPFTDIADK